MVRNLYCISKWMSQTTCFPWLSSHWAAPQESPATAGPPPADCHGPRELYPQLSPLLQPLPLLLSSLLKSCCFNYHLCADESQISRPFCSHSQLRISFWIFATSPNAVCWKAVITFLPKPSLLPTSFPISVNNSTTLCPTSSQPGCHFQLLFASHTNPVDFLPTAVQKYFLSFPLMLQLFNPCSFLPLGLWHPHSIIIPCPPHWSQSSSLSAATHSVLPHRKHA